MRCVIAVLTSKQDAKSTPARPKAAGQSQRGRRREKRIEKDARYDNRGAVRRRAQTRPHNAVPHSHPPRTGPTLPVHWCDVYSPSATVDRAPTPDRTAPLAAMLAPLTHAGDAQAPGDRSEGRGSRACVCRAALISSHPPRVHSSVIWCMHQYIYTRVVLCKTHKTPSQALHSTFASHNSTTLARPPRLTQPLAFLNIKTRPSTPPVPDACFTAQTIIATRKSHPSDPISASGTDDNSTRPLASPTRLRLAGHSTYRSGKLALHTALHTAPQR